MLLFKVTISIQFLLLYLWTRYWRKIICGKVFLLLRIMNRCNENLKVLCLFYLLQDAKAKAKTKPIFNIFLWKIVYNTIPVFSFGSELVLIKWILIRLKITFHKILLNAKQNQLNLLRLCLLLFLFVSFCEFPPPPGN